MLLTNDTLGKGGSHKSGQSQVPYLDGACGAGYEDVVTLEVPVDYWRSPGVKEVKALQDLPTPAPQNLGLHHLKALQVTVQRGKRTKMSPATVGKHKSNAMTIKSLSILFCMSRNTKLNDGERWKRGKCANVLSVPDVMSSVTSTMHFLPRSTDSQES